MGSYFIYYGPLFVSKVLINKVALKTLALFNSTGLQIYGGPGSLSHDF